MECKYCSSKWESIVQPGKCPFCGEVLVMNVDADSFAGILSMIFEKFGKEILNDPRKLIAFSSDFASTYKKEQKMLKVAVSEGIAAVFYEIATNERDSSYEISINKAIHRLMNDALLSEKNASEIIDIFIEALSLPRIERKKIDEILTKSEEDISKLDKSKTDSYTTANHVSAHTIHQYGDMENDFKIKGGVLHSYDGVAVDVVIPDTVNSVKKRAFKGCNLKSIVFPTTITRLDAWIPQTIEEVVLPSSLQVLGEQVFRHCTYLEKVEIPKTVHRIEKHCFEGCTSLIGADLPQGLEFLGFEAFKDCTSLITVSIPRGPKGLIIEGNTFLGCTGLTSVNVSDGVMLSGGMFHGCINLMTSNAKQIQPMWGTPWEQSIGLNDYIRRIVKERYDSWSCVLCGGKLKRGHEKDGRRCVNKKGCQFTYGYRGGGWGRNRSYEEVSNILYANPMGAEYLLKRMVNEHPNIIDATRCGQEWHDREYYLAMGYLAELANKFLEDRGLYWFQPVHYEIPRLKYVRPQNTW